VFSSCTRIPCYSHTHTSLDVKHGIMLTVLAIDSNDDDTYVDGSGDVSGDARLARLIATTTAPAWPAYVAPTADDGGVVEAAAAPKAEWSPRKSAPTTTRGKCIDAAVKAAAAALAAAEVGSECSCDVLLCCSLAPTQTLRSNTKLTGYNSVSTGAFVSSRCDRRRRRLWRDVCTRCRRGH
jgi:hypothetical protein